jgi:hypothetical protein
LLAALRGISIYHHDVLRFAVIVILACVGVAAAHDDKYPMPASEYKQKADQRLVRYKTRLEQHMTAQKLDATTRESVRKRLATLEAEVRALVAKLAKDGTITLTEANEVKQLGKTGREAIYRDFKIDADEKKPKASR